MTIVERLRTRGILRIGTPRRGFRYRHSSGRPVTRGDRQRIEALRIPPAWTDVAISAAPRAAVQGVGRDAAGRWQYVYHVTHVARRERRKQERLVRFMSALPALRRVIRRDLALPGMPRPKVLAGILTILSTCFLRPGSEEYADANGSFGIATLRRQHVSVRGDVVRFDFQGKSGRRHQRELRDRRLARLVRELLKHRGEVFKFRADDDSIVDVRARHINEYIKEVMGEQFSAKDFRTWAANLLCACALARAGEIPAAPGARKRHVASVMREVAEHLCNTPAVCRASYVLDTVIEAYDRGRVVRPTGDVIGSITNGNRRALERSERSLVALLRRTPMRGAA